jgi:hypothetical protein
VPVTRCAASMDSSAPPDRARHILHEDGEPSVPSDKAHSPEPQPTQSGAAQRAPERRHITVLAAELAPTSRDVAVRERQRWRMRSRGTTGMAAI